jgi:probable rRNA maturation factor
MSLDVDLLDLAASNNLPTQSEFKQWVNAAVTAAKQEIPASINSIHIRLVSKQESAQLNETYRHKSGPTNILSFHYDPIPGASPDSLGDLVICSELVNEEATNLKKSIISHWAHLTVHGVLHLLGFDHENDDDANIMEALETKIITALGFENPYQIGDTLHHE